VLANGIIISWVGKRGWGAGAKTSASCSSRLGNRKWIFFGTWLKFKNVVMYTIEAQQKAHGGGFKSWWVL
jgi:hypothetical protein